MDTRGSKDLAREYYKTALSNLNAARELFKSGYYPEAVFFAQQAVEKIAKAILVLSGQNVTGHSISGWLAMEIADKLENVKALISIVSELENYVTKARYPFRVRDHLISPITFFTRERTEKIIKKAEFAFTTLEQLLTTVYLIKEE